MPTIIISFYQNFANQEDASGQVFGFYALFIVMIVCMIQSFAVSKMTFGLWYHEVFFCGVSKLSWSVTSIAYPTEDIEMRTWWMPIFETYFGFSIKFLNPAILTFLLFQNVSNDLTAPYAEQPASMQVIASIWVFSVLVILVLPFFVSDQPLDYQHHPNVEFIADEIHDWRLRSGKMAVEARLAARKYANRPVTNKIAGYEDPEGAEMVPMSDEKGVYDS